MNIKKLGPTRPAFGSAVAALFQLKLKIYDQEFDHADSEEIAEFVELLIPSNFDFVKTAELLASIDHVQNVATMFEAVVRYWPEKSGEWLDHCVGQKPKWSRNNEKVDFSYYSGLILGVLHASLWLKKYPLTSAEFDKKLKTAFTRVAANLNEQWRWSSEGDCGSYRYDDLEKAAFQSVCKEFFNKKPRALSVKLTEVFYARYKEVPKPENGEKKTAVYDRVYPSNQLLVIFLESMTDAKCKEAEEESLGDKFRNFSNKFRPR